MAWSTVVVAIVSALAALGGSLGAQLVQGRREAARRAHEAKRENWRERRDVYADLLSHVSYMLSIADSAAASGRPAYTSGDDVRALLRAQAAARLAAPADTWAEMSPLVVAARVRVNAKMGMRGIPAEAFRQRLAELDAVDGDGLDRLLERYLEAVRRDLGPMPT